jgi:glutathione reductase (NADPH)
MAFDVDVVVIGGGPGGLAAAHALARTKKVLVAEDNLWGGTCPNFGCDPKKMLYGVTEAVRQTRSYAGSGVSGVALVDWPQMMAFKRGYTDSVPAGTESGLASAGIEHVHAKASFIDAHTLRVGDRVVTTDKVIIATGAHAARPDIPGAELLETSTDFLSLTDKPDAIGFIGAGYVAIELANIAAAADVTVHVFQHNHRILRNFPEEYTQLVAEDLARKGVIWHWDTEVQEVRDQDDGVQAHTTTGDFDLNHLYVAMARPANTDGLNLDQVGIKQGKGGITVSDHLQTSQANVYAIGDVAGSNVPKLTPVAGLEGRYVAGQILGDSSDPIKYPAIPHAVFAGPELASVGVTLDAAQADPDAYAVTTQDVGSWYTYNRIRDTRAKVSVITRRNDGIIVGAIAYATNAEELINYLSDMISHEKPASNLAQWMPVYPSVASDLGYFY